MQVGALSYFNALKRSLYNLTSLYRNVVRPEYDELRRRLFPPLDPPAFLASPVCQLHCPSCPTAQGVIRNSAGREKAATITGESKGIWTG